MKNLNDYYDGSLPSLEDIFKRTTIFIVEYQTLSDTYTDKQLQEFVDAFQGDIHLLNEFHLPKVEEIISDLEFEIDNIKIAKNKEYNDKWPSIYKNYKKSETSSASIKLANVDTANAVSHYDIELASSNYELSKVTNKKRKIVRTAEQLSKTSIAIAMRLKHS